MRRFSFATGSEFTEGGRLHKIGERTSAAGEPGWFVTCQETADTVVRTLADLQRAHSARELVGRPAGSTVPAAGQQARRTRSDDDLTDAERARKRGRMRFLKYVERNLPPAARTTEVKDARTGEMRSAFTAVLEEAAKHAALAPVPSAATYYRWLKLREEGADALAGKYSNCGNRRQVEPTVRRIVKDTFHVVLDESVAVIKAGGQVRLRMKALTAAVDAAIKQAKSLDPMVALTRPSRSTLYDWWSGMPAVKRDTLRLGVVKTRQAYRFTTGHERPVNALDEAEFDECDTPIFVCDDETSVLLGRLTLCWTIDVACHAVTGLDLSFEPPGDTTMMSTFKNAIMPKSYLTQAFPELSGRWLQFGIPRLIRVDRSRQALGKTAEELSARLDVDWDWCDAMTPYFKAYVETMFRILNQMLLEELSGYVLPVNQRRADYDPTANGLIRMRDLMCIIHAFIVFYNEKPQASLGGLSPNAAWLRSTARVAPELPDDAEDVARLFAILRKGRVLDHNESLSVASATGVTRCRRYACGWGSGPTWT